MAAARTARQITEHFNTVEPHDPFGWLRESLLDALEYNDAKPWLLETTKPDDWPGGIEYARATARGYIPFAVSKALGHRGLSASRSVEHFRGWLYALGLDDQVDWTDYAPYGAPILAACARVLDTEVVLDDEHEAVMWRRMRTGDTCRPGCDEGCVA